MSSKSASAHSTVRDEIQRAHICDESKSVHSLIQYLSLEAEESDQLVDEAAELVRILRRSKNPGLMETFLSEYGLSTEEGVALMCLAEALLRVPDEETIDVLIRDKISAANWGQHLGHSTSPLVNASTWALMLTGKVISPTETESWDIVRNIRHLIRRAGEPVVRKAVAQSMKILGHQFVLGRTIEEATVRAKGMQDKGYQYSYDMLGEAATTAEDATGYFLKYSRAISRLSEESTNADIRDNPGISVKLSALHPRYEFSQHKRVMTELVPRVSSLVLQAKNAQMGFNIDAEEADRLDLSLDVIEAVLSEPDLAGWDGFGIVVQAYGPRAFYVLDWCYELATRLDRRIMVRLVKGAYWDTEIKQAQVDGLDGFPVFTRKAATDISYMACAKKLLSMTDRIYPQFATHNAHSIATVMKLAGTARDFEFQRLHGMGEALHDLSMERYGSRCRIYAPVGVHEDLLAYLVRRLLENGANSSFVNQVLDDKVPARQVVCDPITQFEQLSRRGSAAVPLPQNVFADHRQNSEGINFSNPAVLDAFVQEQSAYAETVWQAAPVIAGACRTGKSRIVYNPANHEQVVGEVIDASPNDIHQAVENAKLAQPGWAEKAVASRAQILEKIADLLEENRSELMALLAREAGKTPLDALGEVREAVDFCRYYAVQATGMDADVAGGPLGIFVCISPWNFPLAIFAGQVVAALVTGNAVLAKPAEQSPLVAAFAVKLMHQAGIPGAILHLLPGEGATVGHALVSHPDIAGVCFTGSTQTAQHINRTMAESGPAHAPIIAETGGLNAMIVDSTALPEQAVRDIIASAFQSAGQRCSALRILYVQEDISEKILAMLKGAMAELRISDPWYLDADAGPVIDRAAKEGIEIYVSEMEAEGSLIKRVQTVTEQDLSGYFVAPTLLRVTGIEQMKREVFGPILHVATYKAGEIETVIDSINQAGYGLTMGLHTRVDSRVQEVADLARVGNFYVNRNQIGAVVGLQPFGGEGLSGTGPKAGGPLYLYKFVGNIWQGDIEQKAVLGQVKIVQGTTGIMPDYENHPPYPWPMRRKMIKNLKQTLNGLPPEFSVSVDHLLRRLEGFETDVIEFEGPTGESNHLTFHGRGLVLIAGENWVADCLVAVLTGNVALIAGSSILAAELRDFLVQHGMPAGVIVPVETDMVEQLLDTGRVLSGCCLSFGDQEIKEVRLQLSRLNGPLIPLLKSGKSWREFVIERTLSVDTTASGGNATLLASVETQ